MLTESEIREVVEFESPEHPVLSVYLNVDPHRRTAEKYKLALRGLLERAQKADTADIKRVQNYVDMEYDWQGRGLVMFSCAARGFWWVKSFLPPVEDSVMVSYRPYIRQLARLLDTYERYGVIHVQQTGAQLYVFNMGRLEAAENYQGEEVKVHKAGGRAAARYQRHEFETARQNLQDAAELAEDFYGRMQTKHLILAGTDKNIARFKELLSPRLQALVVGQIGVDTNAPAAEIREKALALALQAAKREATDMADRLVTQVRSNGHAVAGLSDTLTAVQNGRAQHVVTLANYAQPAYRFVDSGYILLDLTEESDLQSGKVQELPDAVDSVLRRALLQGIGVTLVDEHGDLAEMGQIGALTRY